MKQTEPTALIAIVVDDEPDLRELMTAILEAEGFLVFSISEPWLLVDNLPSGHPAIILVDLMMPGISGLELAKRLRNGPYSTVPMIALSAAPAVLRVAHDSGYFNATIQKPFDLDELVALVGQHVA